MVAAYLHQHRREEQAAQERAEAGITLSSEQGSSMPLAMEDYGPRLALAEQDRERKALRKYARG